MDINEDITKICKGFGTRDVCGKCEITLNYDNNNHFSFKQFLELLIRLVNTSDKDDSFGARRPNWGIASCCQETAIEKIYTCGPSTFNEIKQIVIDGIHHWRHIRDQTEFDEMSNDRKFAVGVYYQYIYIIRQSNNYGDLREHLLSMYMCAVGDRVLTPGQTAKGLQSLQQRLEEKYMMTTETGQRIDIRKVQRGFIKTCVYRLRNSVAFITMTVICFA